MMDEEDYEGADWQEMRFERMAYDEGECQDCGAKATQVHHIKYPAIKIEDCVSLCESCHLQRHNKDRWEPR